MPVVQEKKQLNSVAIVPVTRSYRSKALKETQHTMLTRTRKLCYCKDDCAMRQKSKQTNSCAIAKTTARCAKKVNKQTATSPPKMT